MNLCDELTIRMLLERHGFHFSKSMGQNFLIDPEIPCRKPGILRTTPCFLPGLYPESPIKAVEP